MGIRICLGRFKGPGALTAAGIALLITPVWGQDFARPDGAVPLPTDWSTKHVIYTGEFSADQVPTMRRDPRLYNSWLLQGHTPQAAARTVDGTARGPRETERGGESGKGGRPRQTGLQRDWAFSLGSAGVAQNMSPAKFGLTNSSITGTVTSSNCTSDFVVYGLNAAETAAGGQANLVALDNLYSGTSASNSAAICGTSGPSVMFAYAASAHSGKISTSPVLSLDGTVVMFVESASGASYLNILRWNSSDGGTVASSKLPSHVSSFASGSSSFATYSAATCTSGSSCMVSITLGTSANTNSSPFYDYLNDVMYVGDNGGKLYKITPVLTSGTTTVTSITLASGKTLTSPVLDSVSGNVFVGASNGTLYAVGTSPTFAALTPGSIQIGDSGGSSNNGALADGPLVDSTNHILFTSVTCNTSSDVASVYEASTQQIGASTNYPGGTTWTALANVQIGNGDTGCDSSSTFQGHLPAFDNAYFSSPSSGHLWACGDGGGSPASTTGSSSGPGLFAISLTSATPPLLHTATGLTALTATSDSECSALTEFYNTNTSTDYLFLGEGRASSFGDLFALKITDTPAVSVITGSPVTETKNNGGVSNIIVDNMYVGGLAGWTASQSYALNAEILDSNGDVEQVTVAGTSDSTAPAWPAVGSTVKEANPSTLTWKNLGPLQTSSLYFGTLGTSTTICGGSAAFCAVKLTDAALQ